MGTFFEDTMTGLLQAISIEQGNIQLEKVDNMPADTYRVDTELNLTQEPISYIPTYKR